MQFQNALSAGQVLPGVDLSIKIWAMDFLPFICSFGSREGSWRAWVVIQRQKATAWDQATVSRGWFQCLNACSCGL
jgi:hypothetical protein